MSQNENTSSAPELDCNFDDIGVDDLNKLLFSIPKTNIFVEESFEKGSPSKAQIATKQLLQVQFDTDKSTKEKCDQICQIMADLVSTSASQQNDLKDCFFLFMKYLELTGRKLDYQYTEEDVETINGLHKIIEIGYQLISANSKFYNDFGHIFQEASHNAINTILSEMNDKLVTRD